METIFGSGEDKTQQVSRGADGAPIVLSPNLFDTQFGEGPFEVRRKMAN